MTVYKNVSMGKKKTEKKSKIIVQSGKKNHRQTNTSVVLTSNASGAEVFAHSCGQQEKKQA